MPLFPEVSFDFLGDQIYIQGKVFKARLKVAVKQDRLVSFQIVQIAKSMTRIKFDADTENELCRLMEFPGLRCEPISELIYKTSADAGGPQGAGPEPGPGPSSAGAGATDDVIDAEVVDAEETK